MSEFSMTKKEIRLIGIGIIVSAFITMFYDLARYFLTSYLTSTVAIPLIIVIAGLIAIAIGLGLLIYFSKATKENENGKK